VTGARIREMLIILYIVTFICSSLQLVFLRTRDYSSILRILMAINLFRVAMLVWVLIIGHRQNFVGLEPPGPELAIPFLSLALNIAAYWAKRSVARKDRERAEEEGQATLKQGMMKNDGS